MGHLTHMKAEYRALLGRMEAQTASLPIPEEAKAREALRDVLEILFTPEQAALASRLPAIPADAATLAERLKIPISELEPALEAMAEKGLVLDLLDSHTGRLKYSLPPPVIGFFEMSMMRAHEPYDRKRLAEALDAYCHADPAFAKEVFGSQTSLSRALVSEAAAGVAERPDVLDWERATAIVRDARKVAVAYCYCRHKEEHLGHRCGAPVENCLSLGMSADFIVRRGFGRAIERSEALELLSQAREHGLVQLADNVQKSPGFICNCCGCCCGQLRAVHEFDLQAVNHSGFQPVFDLEACRGCTRCAHACPVAALELEAGRKPAVKRSSLTPRLNLDRCIGCGVCVTACKSQAMRMERRKVAAEVPANKVELIVSMVLEKGRLPEYVTAGIGSGGLSFLGQLLGALSRLPPARQLMASHQLRSRFVRAIVAGVKGPTKSLQ